MVKGSACRYGAWLQAGPVCSIKFEKACPDICKFVLSIAIRCSGFPQRDGARLQAGSARLSHDVSNTRTAGVQQIDLTVTCYPCC